MTWLATLGTGVVLLISSLFGGVVGLFQHTSTQQSVGTTIAPTGTPVVSSSSGTPPAHSPGDHAAYVWVSLPEAVTVSSSTSYYLSSADSRIHDITPLGDFAIPNADPSSFEVAMLVKGTSMLPAQYARDDMHVFVDATMISGADIASFSILPFADDTFVESPYSKDKNFVYYAGAIPTAATSTTAAMASIAGADPATFTALYDIPQEGGDDTYGKDRNYVYLGDDVIPGANPVTFTRPTP